MSKVNIQYNSSLSDLDGRIIPVQPQIGDLVRYFYNNKNVGIVVELIDNLQSKILWSNFSNPWERVVSGPLKVNYSQIIQDAFQIQPMPQGALPFYLDEVEKRMIQNTDLIVNEKSFPKPNVED
jgi:hypothetical protein